MGFVVNPIAGMGGRVGLKGTNGVYETAVKLGAQPVSPKRAIEFLRKMKETGLTGLVEVITCPGKMGYEEAKVAGVSVQVLPLRIGEETTAEDTKNAVKLFVTRVKTDLIVFVGGDGTAKDILDALVELDVTNVPVLGVPAGVKMYSGVFAVNPLDAVDVVEMFVKGQTQLNELEVMDADEVAIRGDQFAVKLYGYLVCPFVPTLFQGSKQVSVATTYEIENQIGIADFFVEIMRSDSNYILGPGTTIRQVANRLGVEKTLLGVDLYRNGVVVKDVNEQKLLEEIKDWENTWIVVSPIGRQGMLFGRGNQQISPEIIKKVGKEKIIVLATRNKLQGIEGEALRVDTGDPEVDGMLRGYIKVITDYREWRLMPVK